MTERISLSAPSSLPPSTSAEATTVSSSEFREVLHDAARSLAAGEASLGAATDRLSRGRTLSPEELIALQATVYRYAAEVEMASKLTDKLTNAVRTTLTSQQ